MTKVALLALLLVVAGQRDLVLGQVNTGSRPVAIDQKIQRLIEKAELESRADTTFVADFKAAMDDSNPDVRANALAIIPVATTGVANNGSARSQARSVELALSLRPFALSAASEVDGAVRRQALIALSTLDAMASATAKHRAETLGIAGRAFNSDPEELVRATAFRMLVRDVSTRSSAWSLIEQALKDPSPSVRSDAYQAMARAPNPNAIPYLLRALSDETDPFGRVSAAGALAPFVPGDPSLIEAVEQRARVESNDYVKEQLLSIANQLRRLVKQPEF